MANIAPEKARDAVILVNQAIGEGDLTRPITCELCGKSRCRIVGHHWNGYNKPLDVWWICNRCNSALVDKHDGSLTKDEAVKYVAKKKAFTDLRTQYETRYYSQYKTVNGKSQHREGLTIDQWLAKYYPDEYQEYAELP